jgi:hypothetical protein
MNKIAKIHAGREQCKGFMKWRWTNGGGGKTDRERKGRKDSCSLKGFKIYQVNRHSVPIRLEAVTVKEVVEACTHGLSFTKTISNDL